MRGALAFKNTMRRCAHLYRNCLSTARHREERMRMSPGIRGLLSGYSAFPILSSLDSHLDLIISPLQLASSISSLSFKHGSTRSQHCNQCQGFKENGLR